MKIKRWAQMGLLMLSILAGAGPTEGGLSGPWFRYQCDELGFRILVASGWRVTRVPNGVVFAMQYQPRPYVRVAIGRIALEDGALETLIHPESGSDSVRNVRRTECKIDGLDAVKVEGKDKRGPFMDVYVKTPHYGYWISFIADQEDMWPKYCQTFDIVLGGFHFI